MIFRFRPQFVGAHMAIGVWSAADWDRTFAQVGGLRMERHEWAVFRRMLVQGLGGDEREDGTIDIEGTDDGD